MPVRVIDNTKIVEKIIDQNLDLALNSMVIDIDRQSKMQVPVGPGGKTKSAGQLRASGKHERLGPLKYRVFYNKEYASYQHWGVRRDGSRKIRRHTYSGKKTHFLVDPAKIVVSNAMNYFKKFLSK